MLERRRTGEGRLEAKLIAGPDALDALARESEHGAFQPTQMEQHPFWLAHTDHGEDSLGAAMAFYRDGELAGYLPLRARRSPLALRLGEVALARLPYRTLQLFRQGVVGDEENLARCALSSLKKVPYAFDAVSLEEVPSGSAIMREIENEGADGFSGVIRSRTTHWLADLPGSFDEYTRRFSSKTRSTLGRKGRRLEAVLGPLGVRVYSAPEEQVAFLETVQAAAARTHHNLLRGKTLTAGDARLRRNLENWAARGWVRAYVLHAGGTPAAWVLGFLFRRTLFYEVPGYDPDRAAESPGLLLLLRVVEELIESGLADAIDFGAGDADYKRLFGTRSYPEATVFLVRKTLYALGASGLQSALATASRFAARRLERIGLRGPIKAMIRGHR